MKDPEITAESIAGAVLLVISMNGGTLSLTMSPGRAVEACGNIARAAADAEVWAEQVRERIRGNAR